jgi:hypothetical protein
MQTPCSGGNGECRRVGGWPGALRPGWTNEFATDIPAMTKLSMESYGKAAWVVQAQKHGTVHLTLLRGKVVTDGRIGHIQQSGRAVTGQPAGR